MNIKAIFYSIQGAISLIGATIIHYLGGWDIALKVLVLMMAADYLTGIICALVWKKSPKSEDGAFDSKASIKGLLRKGAILLVVLIACQLDELIGTDFIRTATILFFVANDGFSIIENLGIMGLPIPPAIKNAFDALRSKSQENEDT